MLHSKVRGHRPTSSGEEDLSGFYHIWAWRPSWSRVLDFAIKREMPLPKEAPLIGQAVSKKKIFEIVDDGLKGT